MGVGGKGDICTNRCNTLNNKKIFKERSSLQKALTGRGNVQHIVALVIIVIAFVVIVIVIEILRPD